MEQSKRFGYQIKLLSNAFEQAINRNCELSGLTGVQAFMMGYVVNHPEQPIYAKTLEQVFHLKHPTVCGILQRLESKGFITFATDETDRRCRRIAPTRKAIDAHLQSTQRLDDVDTQLLSGFSVEEAELFYTFLSRAAANVGIPCVLKNQENEEELL